MVFVPRWAKSLSQCVCVCAHLVPVAGMPWVTKVISMFQPYTKMGQGMAYLINFLKKVVDARCNQSTPAVSEKQPTILHM